MQKVTAWGLGLVMALSSVACAEQPRVQDATMYRVVSFAGDDTRDWKEVYAQCDLAECEALAAKLNAREEAFSVERVTP